jgi:Skp family chaperone for outer membrane proteins
MLAAAAAALCGCSSQPSSPIATLDLTRIQANWPKFINYSNQLAADTAAIQRSSAPPARKAEQLEQLRKQFVSMQNEVTSDVRDAAQRVATDKHFSLVVTHEFVGYGGVDITPEVEKILSITEKSPQ